LAVKFEKRAVHNQFKSDQEGRQVFDDVDWINIKIPGDKTTEVSRKVRKDGPDADTLRFKFQWENYLKKEENLQKGIPLEMLPGISPAEVSNLKAISVFTIEQLSGLHEKAIKNMMDGRELVKKAEKFLKGSRS